jgi:NAD(P)-dependent dehydrogenase (short-subunit alcohol dehydrogenase family)
VIDRIFRLDNQTAVVTGACGNLGPVWVEALLDAGARVAALELKGAPASTG